MATIPITVANFQTSLASAISSSATSLVVASIATDDGSNLATGTYGITIDQGTNSQEHIIVTFSGTTTGTVVTRGVSVKDGTTNVAALQFAHSRGASVKMTDHPILIRILRAIIGTDTLDNKISYTSHPTFSSNTEIIDKKYADDLAFAGAPDASTTVKGIIEIATSSEAAAGTSAGGTGALLVPPNSIHNATSSATTLIPVTNSSGKLSSGFGGAASSLATLNGSSKVVEDPANATATPTASKIPIADGSGKLDGWVTGNTNSSRTTGEGIDGSSTPQVVCIAVADGLIYKADGNTSTRVQAYGFITTNASISTTPAVTISGIVGGFTGLTANANYYVSDTAGGISVTPSTTCQIPVGRAISTSQIAINFGKKRAFGTLTFTAAAGATEVQSATVGFQPAFVTCNWDILAGQDSAGQGGRAKGYSTFITAGTWQTIGLAGTTNASTAVTFSNYATRYTGGTAASIVVKGNDVNASTSTITVDAISSTGFDIRNVNAVFSGSGGSTSGTISYIAEE